MFYILGVLDFKNIVYISHKWVVILNIVFFKLNQLDMNISGKFIRFFSKINCGKKKTIKSSTSHYNIKVTAEF